MYFEKIVYSHFVDGASEAEQEGEPAAEGNDAKDVAFDIRGGATIVIRSSRSAGASGKPETAGGKEVTWELDGGRGDDKLTVRPAGIRMEEFLRGGDSVRFGRFTGRDQVEGTAVEFDESSVKIDNTKSVIFMS